MEKKRKYQRKEEAPLCKAWIKATYDSINGTNQRLSTLESTTKAYWTELLSKEIDLEALTVAESRKLDSIWKHDKNR